MLDANHRLFTMDEKIAKEQQIKQKIISARKNIRAKYLLLKRGEQMLEQNLQTLYNPIVKPINELTEKISQSSKIKDEVKSEISNIKSEMEEDDTLEEEDDLEKYNPQLFSYMQKYDNTKDKTHIYGFKRGGGGEWKIGNTSVIFQKDYINLNGKWFKLTNGLLELLFKKNSQNYDDSDLDAYKNIFLLTNAHRKKFKSNGQIDGNNSVKYRKVISKLFHEGDGISYRSLNNPKIIYFENPNMLIERLKLLNAEKLAGNTGLENEIISILSELRKLGIIA